VEQEHIVWEHIPLMTPEFLIQNGTQVSLADQIMVVQVQDLVDVVVENLGLDQIQISQIQMVYQRHLDAMQIKMTQVKLVDPDLQHNQEHQETLELTELEMPVVLQPQLTLVVEEEQERLATPMEQDMVVMQKQLTRISGVQVTHMHHPQSRRVPVAVDKTNQQVSLEVAVLLILVVVEMLEQEMQVVMEMAEAVLAPTQQPVEVDHLVLCGSK
tara:strand:+ start:243 stop:884 length:642 start_codon:yes stop_codon:yes gene_type:complete